MLVATGEGVGYMLTTLYTVWRGLPPAVRLYVNDHSPTVLDNLASYTEATFAGYDRILIANPVRDVDIELGAIRVQWDEVSFAPSTHLKDRVRVFGYFVTDFLGAFVLWAERFPVRVYVQESSDLIRFIPTLGGLSEFTG
jgi:hypothetical protein